MSVRARRCTVFKAHKAFIQLQNLKVHKTLVLGVDIVLDIHFIRNAPNWGYYYFDINRL